MFKWKVEDMVLFNQKDGVFIGEEKIYDCENKMSREDKIAFVDNLQEGKLSYLLDLIDKFNKAEDSLPKDKWGNVKTVSLKAWLKKNDIRKIVDTEYKYGNISFLVGRNIEWVNRKGEYDTYSDYVDEIFHRQLKLCENEERKYFLAHDEYSILKDKVRSKSIKYRENFGVHLAFCSNGSICVCDKENSSLRRLITIEELKELLNKYEQLEETIKNITKETKIIY